MKRLCVALIVVALLLVWIGCGSQNTPTTTESITVSPATVSLATGKSQQFTETHTSGVSAVNWQVNGVFGGDTTNGTIDSTTGVYIAPAKVPTTNPVTITAVGTPDNTITATAKVTITQGDPVSVTVLPATASVGTNQTVTFTATVNNTDNKNVTWAVNNIHGGDATHGHITDAGVYTAPSAVPTDTVTVKATSQADTDKSATAAVTVTPFLFVAITASSNVQPLLAGNTRTFTATVDSHPAHVTWKLNCGAQGSDCGTISSTSDSTGLYTAPRTPPPGGDVTVTATTTDNSANPGATSVTIAFGNGSLNGAYAFSLSGENAAGALVGAGSVNFDGAGRVTSAVEDVNGTVLDSHGTALNHIDFNAGTYNIGTDGRGNVVLQMKEGDTVTLQMSFRLALERHTHGAMIGFDSGAGKVSGTLDAQDPAAFTLAALNGKYGLALNGATAAGPNSLAVAGALTADGAGHLTAGLLDANHNGTVSANQTLQTASSGYAVDDPSTSGRGTMTVASDFGTQHFILYVVDVDHVKLVQTDSGRFATATLVKQAAATYTAASFTGSFAFVFAGSSASLQLSHGGVFTMDGAGKVTTGVLDANVGGTTENGLTLLQADYAVASDTFGRTTLALKVPAGQTTKTYNYVFYPQASGALNFVGVDSTQVAAGTAFAQDQGPFSHASFNGLFALVLSGTDLTGNPGPMAISGLLVPNGSSAITGTMDINDSGITAAAIAVQGGSYTIAANGVGTAALHSSSPTFTSGSFNLYLVNSSTALLMGADSNRVLVGTVQKQY